MGGLSGEPGGYKGECLGFAGLQHFLDGAQFRGNFEEYGVERLGRGVCSNRGRGVGSAHPGIEEDHA